MESRQDIREQEERNLMRLIEATRLAHEAEEMVLCTGLKLKEQREQMERIHYKTKVIDSKLDKSNYVLDSMKST